MRGWRSDAFFGALTGAVFHGAARLPIPMPITAAAVAGSETAARDYALTGRVDLQRAITSAATAGAITYAVSRWTTKHRKTTLPPPPQTTREVILDTNAVYDWQRAQGLLRAGDVPVITRTTQAEIRNLAAAGRMKPPGYLDNFSVIEDVMDINTRINIRGALRPGQRGIFGDGPIGATAINRGSSVITFDRNFADVLRQFGVNVL